MRGMITFMRWLGWAYIAVVCLWLVRAELGTIMGHGLDVWELSRPMTPVSLLLALAVAAVSLAPGALLVALAARISDRRRHRAASLLRASA